MKASASVMSQLRQLRRQAQRGRKLEKHVETRKHRSRRVLVTAAALFLPVAAIWASRAQLDEVVRGKGKVIPDSSTQIIQSLEAGIIKEILVREGDTVAKGDVLLKLHDAQIAATYEQERTKRQTLRASIVRLLAEARGREELDFPEDLEATEPELVETEQELFQLRRVDQDTRESVLRQRLDNATSRLRLKMPAIEKGSISQVDRLEMESEILRLEGELATLRTGFVREAMEKYDQEASSLAALEESIRAHEDRLERTVIKSPLDGVINAFFVDTVERVVGSGDAIMEIVPLGEELAVEAKLLPQDIAFVHKGQRAVIRFTAFDPTIYGGLEGFVDTIGVDTINTSEGEIYYPCKIRVEGQTLGIDSRTGKPLQLVPGMVAEVDIITGSKSLLNYLLKPIKRAQIRALREN